MSSELPFFSISPFLHFPILCFNMLLQTKRILTYTLSTYLKIFRALKTMCTYSIYISFLTIVLSFVVATVSRERVKVNQKYSHIEMRQLKMSCLQSLTLSYAIWLSALTIKSREHLKGIVNLLSNFHSIVQLNYNEFYPTKHVCYT